MDDLIRIKGVGAATAKKLAEAGITSFAALAELTPEHEQLAAIAQTPEHAAAWIAAAAELAKEPPQVSQGKPDTPPESDGQSGGGNPATPATEPKVALNEKPAAKEKTRPAQVNDSGVLITVIGPAKGLRRAGRLFGSTPSTIRVTGDELKLIEADPGLSVTPGDASKEVTTGGEPAARLTLEECLDGKGKVRAIRVLGPKSGRRRGGHAFGAEAVTLTPSKDQLEQILGDAELSVALA